MDQFDFSDDALRGDDGGGGGGKGKEDNDTVCTEEEIQREAEETRLSFHHLQREALTDIVLQMRDDQQLVAIRDMVLTGRPDASNTAFLARYGITFSTLESATTLCAIFTYTGCEPQDDKIV